MDQHIQSINLSRLLREGGTLEASGEINGAVRLENETIPLDGVAKWKVTVTRVEGEGGEELWMSGEVAGNAVMECRRCLKPTSTPVRAHFQHMLRHQPGLPQLEVVEEDDEEIFLFPKPDLDLSPFISEAFALELPYTVLCREDCEGLCEHCGADVGETPDCCPERTRPKGKMAGLLEKLEL